MTYEVVDNYLPDDEFKQLSGFLMGSNFPVYYADNVAIGGVEEKNPQCNYYFTHNFVLNGESSTYAPNIWRDHFQSRFGPIELIRFKMNVFPSTSQVYEHAEHTDFDYPHSGALLCLNTCNGYTKIGEEKIPSVANRMIFFDTSAPHQSTTCSDQPVRANIVINYKKVSTPPMHLICPWIISHIIITN